MFAKMSMALSSKMGTSIMQSSNLCLITAKRQLVTMNYTIDKGFLPFQITRVQTIWKKLTSLKNHLYYFWFVYLCDCGGGL